MASSSSRRSAVRITGGQARGRRLEVPVAAGVRPTSARVREALFSMLGQELTGWTVLDAFGGSGLLALEAWSRGAAVTVVERNRAVARQIRANAAALGADISVRVGDVLSLVGDLAPVDLVLVDPPYAHDTAPILAALAPLARRALVLEADARTDVGGAPGLVLERHKVYGGTALWFYRCTPPGSHR